MPEQKTTVEVEGHQLVLSHLDKVLYPETGTTKRDVLSYYAKVAPMMLPHLAGRPVTFHRAPDGVEGGRFFEKRVPRGAPRWFHSLRVPSKGPPSGGATKSGAKTGAGADMIDYPEIDGLPALIWAANLAVIEFHTPMWRVDARKRPKQPDLLVFDLDPGVPAAIAECCVVAQLLREVLTDRNLTPLVKTSGSKGMQIYAKVPPRSAARADTLHYARDIAQFVEQSHRDLVVSNMRRDLRAGKVLIDWSQNNPSKTTIAVYSLRLRPVPAASTPLRWQEVEDVAASGDGDRLHFDYSETLSRIDRYGDLFASLARGN